MLIFHAREKCNLQKIHFAWNCKQIRSSEIEGCGSHLFHLGLLFSRMQTLVKKVAASESLILGAFMFCQLQPIFTSLGV